MRLHRHFMLGLIIAVAAGCSSAGDKEGTATAAGKQPPKPPTEAELKAMPPQAAAQAKGMSDYAARMNQQYQQQAQGKKP